METTFRQKMLRKWGLKKLHEIAVDSEVSKDHRDQLSKLLYDFPSLKGKYVNYAIHDADLYTFSTPEGKLPKRILAALYKRLKVKLPDDELKALNDLCAEIGQTCSRHETWLVNLSRRCWWNAGSFGDGDACWFDDKRYHIREMHRSPNFLAFTAYYPNEKRKGNRIDPYPPEIAPELPEGVRGACRMWLWFDSTRGDCFSAVSAYGLNVERGAALISAMLPDHIRAYGAHVDYYDTELYDNGGYMFWPKDSDQPKGIVPTFTKDMED